MKQRRTVLRRCPHDIKPRLSGLRQIPFNGAGLHDCGKTVTKPDLLSRLGLVLSDKQIPQVVERFES
jgi:hypothetical protein